MDAFFTDSVYEGSQVFALNCDTIELGQSEEENTMAGFSGRAQHIRVNSIQNNLTDDQKQELLNSEKVPTASELTSSDILDGTIQAYKVLVKTTSDKVRAGNSATVSEKDAVVGVSLDGGIDGERITYARFKEVYMKAHGFAVQKPLFLSGSTGDFSTTAPTSGFVKKVGVVLDQDRIAFDVLSSDSIKL